MTARSKNRRSRGEQGAEEEPQVYSVQKDLTGWGQGRGRPAHA
jgi:hypothetical protein